MTPGRNRCAIHNVPMRGIYMCGTCGCSIIDASDNTAPTQRLFCLECKEWVSMKRKESCAQCPPDDLAHP
jgi:hypothetical protein